MFREQRVRPTLLRTLTVLLLLLTSVGSAAASASQATTSSPARPSSVAATPSCSLLIRFHRNAFSNPTKINNKWFPLAPGTKFVLTGHAISEGRLEPHRVVIIVTDLTKVINGVRTLVIWERDFSAGQLVESELAFHAQDRHRNVWHFGEYPEDYENGKFVGAPDTWIAGLAGAKSGILMLAKPRVGTPAYLQGLARAIEFVDCAKVLKTGLKTCIPGKCYSNVLLIDEWNPLVPEDGHQRKYYAPRVGNVRVGFVGGPEHETLVLAKVAHLCAKALAEVREAALKLDRRAYRVSKLYRHTPPAEHTLRARPCR
jgi:hypothetical protein